MTTFLGPSTEIVAGLRDLASTNPVAVLVGGFVQTSRRRHHDVGDRVLGEPVSGVLDAEVNNDDGGGTVFVRADGIRGELDPEGRTPGALSPCRLDLALEQGELLLGGGRALFGSVRAPLRRITTRLCVGGATHCQPERDASENGAQ
jgi:hypothetical protein